MVFLQFRGITEGAQYPTVEICLANGEVPHPAAMLNDFLRDGDTLLLTLGHKVDVDSKSNFPLLSKWSTVAYTSDEGKEMNNNDDGDDDSEHKDSEISMKTKSQSEFMRLILQSQMLNQKRIDHNVEAHWSNVTAAMPKLIPKEAADFKIIFQKYWVILVEVFQAFSTDGLMSLQGFRQLVEDVELFPARDSPELTSRIFSRTRRATGSNGGLNIGQFIVLLLMCAQLRNNDTYDAKGHNTSSASAVHEVFVSSIIPCAEKLGLPSILKLCFSSDDCLFQIRQHHDSLFTVFERYAARSHILPTSLKIQNMAELLADAGLQSDVDIKRTRALFDEVRRGDIIGRECRDSHDHSDDTIPDDELTYPEYVECIARAGHEKYYNPPTIGSSELLSMQECLVKGVQATVNIILK